MTLRQNQILRTFVFLIIFGISASASGRQFIFESAAGIGSSHSPFSKNWRGDVSSGGLFFKEYAIRGTYLLNKYISLSSTFGQISELNTPQIFYYAEEPPFPHFNYPDRYPQNVTYFIPSIRLELPFLRLDLGSILYDSRSDKLSIYKFSYPFNGSHNFKPSAGLELGENSFYIFVRLSDSFPFHSGGGVGEIGLGGRVSDIYEHRIFLAPDNVFDGLLGYRGEARIYKNTALSFGFIIGSGQDEDFTFSSTAGVKITFGK
jgi:hypothetical protein